MIAKGRTRVVLGIDAAWTLTQPSGVALVVDDGAGWRAIAAAPSYGHFLAIADGYLFTFERPRGSAPVAADLLAAAALLAGQPVDLVAIDMPLARSPIIARREADNAVSRAYGGRKCGTHTPSAVRPGAISDTLRKGFGEAGYRLCTRDIESPGLIEVYPHPALLELTGAAERLPYKAGKIRAYWGNLELAERKAKLLDRWAGIATDLDNVIAGASAFLPLPGADAAGWKLKAHEDVLDAVVCAWVASVALNGQAVPFGDDDAAIWIPAPHGTRVPFP
jgi:predicted RNase H-like nuclease